MKRSDLLSDPIEQCRLWMQDARDSPVFQPDAMTLATASTDGRPSARIVILKQIDDTGFVFCTSYRSHKAAELDQNPYAALVLYWDHLHRQVRIEGRVEKISEETSDAYHAQRSRGKQIGVWASPQSQEIESRDWLAREVARYEEQFTESEPVPRPPDWGGYRMLPYVIEFWQGAEDRLHDRFRYRKKGDGGWHMHRLAP